MIEDFYAYMTQLVEIRWLENTGFTTWIMNFYSFVEKIEIKIYFKQFYDYFSNK